MDTATKLPRSTGPLHSNVVDRREDTYPLDEPETSVAEAPCCERGAAASLNSQEFPPPWAPTQPIPWSGAGPEPEMLL
jgi:hypothetical protein